MIIGIDLGTTNSAAAFINNQGVVEMVVNRDGKRTTPSVVMFEDDVTVVGEQAKDNSIVDEYHVCSLVKRHMGKKSFSFDVTMDKKYTAEEISAIILKYIKEDAEAMSGEPVEGAVITIPAYFGDAERNATRDAGEIAGLNVLGIINEPTAAAIAYCQGKADEGGNMMVFDLGGGTFDITIIQLSDDLDQTKIIATNGNKNLGGFDIDNTIINRVNDKFQEAYGIDLDDDIEVSQELRIKAEKLKESLSFRPRASMTITAQGKTEKFDFTREEFEEMIKPIVDSTKACMEVALSEAGITWNDINKILLVGGSTRIPAFSDMIRKTTGIEPSHELNPDEAVAIGAAYYADNLYSQKYGNSPKSNKPIEVLDVNSHSLGVIVYNENDERRASFIIPKNSPIPAAETEIYSTHHDGQTDLLIEVVEGDDEDPDYDHIIGKSLIKLPSPKPKMYPFEIEMSYDVNGIIHLTVKDIKVGIDLGEFDIDRNDNLSENDIREKKTIIGSLNLE